MKLSRVMLGLCACILSLLAAVLGQDKSSPAAPPQDTKAAVTGAVIEHSGTGVRGAIVTVTNGAGVTFSAMTDEQGLYAITDLTPGSYTISVTLRGSQIFQSNVDLSAGQVLAVSVENAPSAATDSKRPPSAPPDNPAPPPRTEREQPSVPSSSKTGEATQEKASAPKQSETQASPPTVSLPPPTAPLMPVLAGSQPASDSQSISTVGGTCSGPGTIGGTVTDQSGAVLVGAKIRLTSASGAVQNAVSDEKGNYCFKGLPAGSYTVSVTMQAFKIFEAAGVTLAVGQEIPLDAMLEPAGETTEVEVTGQKVAQVETENAQVQGTITETEVKTLMLNGRNFTQLIALTPGVSNQTGQDEAKVGVVGSVKYSVNGGRVEYNTFEVDGGDVLNAGLNGAESTLIVYPSLDAIQEVKVLTSNYGAQYGRTASGTVLVTTKSGGEKWHGDGYEFWRNEALNARNYFDQTTKAPVYRRNDFGFTIGGPIIKGKTYVFGSEEFRIEKSPTDQQPDFNRGVPSLAERMGNFSDLCPDYLASGGAFDPTVWPDCPASGPSSAGAGLLREFQNNDISQPNSYGVIDPNAAGWLSTNLIPLPNAVAGCNSTIGSCYNSVISEPTHWREDLIRLDHNFSQKIRVSLRFIHDSWDTVVPIPEWQHLPTTTVNSFPTLENKFVGPGISAVAGLTQTLTPTLLNQLTATFANSHITLSNMNGPGGANYQRPTSLGQPGGNCQTLFVATVSCPMGAIFHNGFAGKAPGVVIAGNNGAYGGSGFTADTAYMPWDHTDPIYSYRDDLTKTIGKHTLQLGAQAIFSEKNELNPAVGAATGDVQGLLTFGNVNAGAANTGNAFANFLIFFQAPFGGPHPGANAIQSYTQDSAQRRYYSRYQIGEPYIQDDWKVSSRLTLNLGVRFSLFGLYYERYRAAYNWDPSAFSVTLASQAKVDPTTGQLLDAASGTPIPINLANPDPRILNGVMQCGINGVPSGCMKGNIFNPAPRVGFAFDPMGNGKTSIRGGYGMFFEHGTGQEANTGSLEASSPLVLNMTQRFPSQYGCIGGSAGAAVCTARPGAYPLNVTAIPTKAVWPYSQQWSFSVQRELPGSMVATIAYVGSKATHLTVERQLNQLKPVSAALNPFGIHEPLIPKPTQAQSGDCTGFSPGSPFPLSSGTSVGSQNPAYINLEAACAGVNGGPILKGGGFSETTATPDVNTLRPYPGLGQIYSLENVANASYHSGQATLRRIRGPLTIGGSYSYSHSIDNSSDRSDTTLVNSYDLRSNRASSNYDQRHLLSISYIYRLPNLSQAVEALTSGRQGESTGDGQDSTPGEPSRLVRVLGDGWEFSGITVFQSGTPFSVINGGSSTISVLDNAGVANGVGAGSYPDLASNPSRPPDERFNTRSFGPLLGNPNMFVAPRGLTFGNAGRNFFSNPSRLNFDISILKHFKVTEGSVLEFRAEAFNIFNHTQFRIFDPNLGNTGSNVISCYGGPNFTAGYAAPLDPVTGANTGTDCVTGSAFLHPVDAHRPRTIQLGLKYLF